jgi:hypothetical protein
MSLSKQTSQDRRSKPSQDRSKTPMHRPFSKQSACFTNGVQCGSSTFLAHKIRFQKVESNPLRSSTMQLSFAQSSLLVLFIWVAATGVTAEENKECDATYSVNLAATYPDDLAIKCTDEDMDLITEVINSVVEIDAITSRVSKHVPHLEFVSEEYSSNVTIGDAGLATPPDASEIIKHLTVEDMLEEVYYEHGVDGEAGHKRRLGQLLKGARQPRRMQSEDQAAAKVDQARRRAATMNCSTYGSCRKSWCCQICGICWNKGRQRRVEEGGESDEEYLHKMKMHEERVSSELEKKLRYLARKQAVPCLGNFWQLEVDFKLIL